MSEQPNTYKQVTETLVKDFSETIKRRTWRSALGTGLVTAGTTLATAGFGWNTLIAAVCSGVGGYLLWLDGSTKKKEDQYNKILKEIKGKENAETSPNTPDVSN